MTTKSNQAAGSKAPKPKIWDGRRDQLEGMRYAILPGGAADDLRLKGLHFRILAHLGRQNAKRGFCRICQSELAEKWGFHRGSVNKAIRELVSWGHVEALSQQESRESWCAYRVVIDAEGDDGGVSPADDTPPPNPKSCRKGGVSSGDDRGVSSSRQECHPPGDTHHTDHTDKTDQQERGAQARPAQDDSVSVIEGEIIEPTKGKMKPKRAASAAEGTAQSNLWGEVPRKTSPRRPKLQDLIEQAVEATGNPEATWKPSQGAWDLAVKVLGTEVAVKRELRKFTLYWLGEGRRKEDWDAAFLRWVDGEVEKRQEREEKAKQQKTGSRRMSTDEVFDQAFGRNGNPTS